MNSCLIKLPLVLLVSFSCLHSLAAEDGVASLSIEDQTLYETALKSWEAFARANEAIGLPAKALGDAPKAEDYRGLAQKSRELAEVAGDRAEGRKEALRRWLNPGLKGRLGDPINAADHARQRQERLWAASAIRVREHEKNLAEAKAWAKRNNINEIGTLPGGGKMGLVGLRNGIPQFNVTHSAQAADTIAVDELWPGGSTGLALTGSGAVLGIWDGGDVLTSHLEFMSGATSRLTDQDGVSPLGIDLHPTAVAGVMTASGSGVGQAKGMAYSSQLWTYDWDDDLTTEMNSAYANGVRVSNHSYGKPAGWGGVYDTNGAFIHVWYGDVAISANESHLFGLYREDAFTADDLVYGNETSLPAWSAGNERDDNAPAPGTTYFTFSNGSTIQSTANRPNDYFQNGYDTLSDIAVAKNVLVVGAVNKIVGGYNGIASVVLAPFSSCGPTDDGRIKPDLVAAGVDLTAPVRNPADPNHPGYYVFSTGNNASPSYATGTSFSAPAAAGAAGLLVELRQRLAPGKPLLASSLKALLIHTADEAGTTGPDYRFGWGLINGAKAGNLLQADHNAGGKQHVAEVYLPNGDFIERVVTATGGVPLIVSICWTDPAGPIQPNVLDPTNPTLVNDLDIRVVGPAGTALPWILNPASPSTAATTGDNTRDNVEQIVVSNPAPSASYTIRITHKGTLVDDTGNPGVQPVSLVVTGIQTPAHPPTKINQLVVDNTTHIVGWTSIVGQMYRLQSSPSLTLPVWTDRSADISATKEATTWEAPPPSPGEVLFYRVIMTN